MAEAMMTLTPHRVADDEARTSLEDELIGRTSSQTAALGGVSPSS